MHKRIPLSNISKKNILYISTTEIDENFKANYHSHPNLEILIFTKGKGKIITNNKQIPVKEGDAVVINQSSNHFEVSDSKCTFYAIGINDSNAFLKNTFSKKIIYFPLNKEDFTTVCSLYDIINKEAENEADSTIIDSCFDAIVSILKRNKDIYFTQSFRKNYSSLVSTAAEILDNYFFSNLTVEDIAKRLSVSTSRLCHQFKKEMGITLIEYKLHCQISEAYNLLKITDMSIAAISSAVGFNDSAYFNKVFKRAACITPKQYRERIRNGQIKDI